MSWKSHETAALRLFPVPKEGNGFALRGFSNSRSEPATNIICQAQESLRFAQTEAKPVEYWALLALLIPKGLSDPLRGCQSGDRPIPRDLRIQPYPEGKATTHYQVDPSQICRKPSQIHFFTTLCLKSGVIERIWICS